LKRVGTQVVEVVTVKHCTTYGINIKLFDLSKTSDFYYFIDCNKPNCIASQATDIKFLIDWLYMYRFMTMAFPDHEIVKRYFGQDELRRIIEWAK